MPGGCIEMLITSSNNRTVLQLTFSDCQCPVVVIIFTKASKSGCNQVTSDVKPEKRSTQEYLKILNILQVVFLRIE